MGHHIFGEHEHGHHSHLLLLLPHPSSGCTSELLHFIPVCAGSRITSQSGSAVWSLSVRTPLLPAWASAQGGGGGRGMAMVEAAPAARAQN